MKVQINSANGGMLHYANKLSRSDFNGRFEVIPYPNTIVPYYYIEMEIYTLLELCDLIKLFDEELIIDVDDDNNAVDMIIKIHDDYIE